MLSFFYKDVLKFSLLQYRIRHFSTELKSGQLSTGENFLEVVGWVRHARKQRKLTFLNIYDGSSPRTLQVICPSSIVPSSLTIGCSVKLFGELKQLTPKEDTFNTEQFDHCELTASLVEVLNTSCDQSHEVVGRKLPDLGLMRSREGLLWRHRQREIQSVLRVRRQVKRCVDRVLDDQGYLEVDTPLLTSVDCEGSGEQYAVSHPNHTQQQPSSLYLTGTGQMHLEVLALGLGKVFTSNQTFRAEPSHSRMHLAEFRMIEAESVYLTSIPSLCTEIELLVREIMMAFLDDCADSNNPDFTLDVILANHGFGNADEDGSINPVETIRSVISDQSAFPRLTFAESMELLNCPSQAKGLSRAQELDLVEIMGGRPVFVTNFPRSVKPAYCAVDLASDTALAVDLLMPGMGELVGGSIRCDSAEQLKENAMLNGIQLPEWYTAMRTRPAYAPHGGFGLGFDRLIMFLTSINNIRDVTPFPREINKIYL